MRMGQGEWDKEPAERLTKDRGAYVRVTQERTETSRRIVRKHVMKEEDKDQGEKRTNERTEVTQRKSGEDISKIERAISLHRQKDECNRRNEQTRI
jgi:hypothetical protein